MSLCPHCHQSVNLADGLCEHCGAVLPAPVPGTSSLLSQPRLCPSCQASLAPDDDMCLHCGAVAPPLATSGQTLSSPLAASGRGMSSPLAQSRLCPSCKSSLAPDDDMCLNCGAVTPPPEGRCPQCGKPYLLGKNFCRICGYKFTMPVSAGILPSQPKIKHPITILKAGEVLHGKYQIKQRIASGGMGAVYLAQDPILKRPVVIKALLSENDPDLVAQSIKEREFLAKLNHANIVTIHEFIGEGQTGYIVMQYVNGETLDALMKQKGTLAVPVAIRAILAILPAFEYLEKLDYVYCDFKPQNVMQETRQDGQEIVKLIDLGTVMKHTPNPDRKSIYGTTGFYAREAIKCPSPETDLYSICRTLAYLVSGMDLSDPQFGMPPAKEYKVFEEYPALYRLLVKGTHSDPTRRFHTAQELSNQLQGVLLQIVGGALGVSVSSRYFVSSTMAPKGKFGLLGETLLDQQDSAISLLISGDQALRTKNFSNAEYAYTQGMHLNHTSIDAYTRLVEVHLEQEHFDQAEVILEQAKQTNAHHWKIDWYMGRLHEAQRRYDDAFVYYSLVRDDLPGELPPLQALAQIKTKQACYSEAITLYNSVLRADPHNIEATLGAADALINLERWVEATTMLDRVHETVARYVDAQLQICEVHLTLVQPITAKGIQTAAMAIDRLKGKSTDPRYYRARGDVYRAARKLALQGKLTPDIKIAGAANNDPRTLGKDAYESYEQYLRSEPDAIDRETIVRCKLEVAPWRPFIFI